MHKLTLAGDMSVEVVDGMNYVDLEWEMRYFMFREAAARGVPIASWPTVRIWTHEEQGKDPRYAPLNAQGRRRFELTALR